MQHSFAQQIALTTHGNAFLTGTTGVDWEKFYPSSNTFTFCEYVRFVDRAPEQSGEQATTLAVDPLHWFEWIAREGVKGVLLVCGQMDGERWPRWFIETIRGTTSDVWDSRWEIGDQGRQDQRIWRVTHGRVSVGQPTLRPPPIDAAELKDRFAATLVAIGDLARRHGLNMFAKPFASALLALNGEPGDWTGYDLAPSSCLPPYARDLLAAAQWAWVFGGMGSWNDLSFEGDDAAEYARLTHELYQAVNEAVSVSANASAPP